MVEGPAEGVEAAEERVADEAGEGVEELDVGVEEVDGVVVLPRTTAAMGW